MLNLYNNQPFDLSTSVDLIDTFTGNGIQDTFTLSNKTGLRLGSVITFNTLQYLRYNGGFTVSGNDFTTSSPPTVASQGVAAGLSVVSLVAFDTDDVEGVINPRVAEAEFYIGNVDDIHLEYYDPLPSKGGISLLFSDLITAAGASIEWVQLACSTQDLAGTAMSYSATGEELLTSPLSAFGTLASGADSLGTTLICGTASSFIDGDYIIINRGNITQEVCKIINISGTTLTITSLNYAHFTGETVYACARKFWAKLIVPDNATGHIAANFFNIGLRIRGVTKFRF